MLEVLRSCFEDAVEMLLDSTIGDLSSKPDSISTVSTPSQRLPCVNSLTITYLGTWSLTLAAIDIVPSIGERLVQCTLTPRAQPVSA